MTNVLINKEWSEAIELLKKNNTKFENAFLDFMEQEIEMSEFKLDYDSITSEEFSIAYLVGYEIEKTKEEKLLELYEHHQKQDSNYSMGYLEGLLDTLYTLEIKVEGIEF